MRDKDTSTYLFKQNLDEIAMLMAYEVSKDFPLKLKDIETPICKTTGFELAEQIILVPILRAGIGLVDGFRMIMPNAKIGHIGMYRDEETLEPQEYYARFPKGLESSKIIIVDPMLATGGSADMANSDCFDTVAELMDDDPSVESSGVTLYSFFRFEDDNGEVQDYRKFDSFGGLVSWSLSDGEYAIKYRAIFSTIFGGYLVFLLLSFCIDVGARAIKLLFLQILSPVAVISSVDPTSSGDRLKEWAKECLKVWVSLFLRLAVIFLVIQLVRIITNSVYSGDLFSKNSGIKLSGNGDIIFWVFIFLILGVFQAANKIPDLIEKATGISMSGELQLNPFKALSSNAGVGLGLSALGIGATAIGSGLTNTFSSALERRRDILDEKMRNGEEARLGWRDRGNIALRSVTSGFGGIFGGGSRAFVGAVHGEKVGKNMRNSFGAAMFARQQREDLHRQGVSGRDVLRSDIDRNLGILTRAQRETMGIGGDEQEIQRRKAAIDREVADRTRPYETYQGYLQQIEQRINNNSEVDRATKELSNAQATGDESKIRAAIDNLKAKKGEAFRQYMGSDSGRAMQDRINNLRREHSELDSNLFNYISDDGGFNGQALKELGGAIYDISEEYAPAREQIRIAEENLSDRKQDQTYEQLKLADKQQRVTGPQPDGWDASWGYGLTGQGAFFGQGRGNGSHTPPPGNPPRNP